MIELLKKELRSLRPMAWLIIAFFLAILAYDWAVEFPDLPSSEHSPDSASVGMLVFVALFSTMTGANLLVGESNEGTLSFLDGLPVSRTRIFFAKVLAAVIVLEILPILSLADDVFSAVIAQQSTSPPIRWDVIWGEFAEGSIAGVYFLAIAALLSFSRRWFMLAIGFLFWGFLWLRVNNTPWIELFDPHELLRFVDDDEPFRFPWRHAGAILAASAVLFALGWRGFNSLGDRAAQVAESARRGCLPAALRFAGMILAPVVWIGAIVYLARLTPTPSGEASVNPLGDEAFATEQTNRYDFVFRESQRDEAEPLIREADKIHDQVTGFLGAEPVAGRIVADLASPVIQHAAGQTNWTKIRMPLWLGAHGVSVEAILGHETTHVYIEQLSQGALTRHFEDARFFHEGLATFVEHRFFSNVDERRGMHQLAAAATARGRVPFEKLVNNAALGKERDPTIAYPLGEVFCEALVATHGPEAPGKLLRAFARPGAPADYKGVEFWRDAMQACGYDLDRVSAAYDSILAKLREENASLLAALPRISGEAKVEGSEVVITPSYQGKAPGRLVCLLEPKLEITIIECGPDQKFHLARSRYPGRSIRYALGWDVAAVRIPIFEPFTNSALDE